MKTAARAKAGAKSRNGQTAALLSMDTAHEWIQELGWNPSLPFAVFDVSKRSLVAANRRFLSMIPGAPKDALESAMDFSELENKWPFSNEFEAGPAQLARLLAGIEFTDKNGEGPCAAFVVQAQLKTYRLLVADLRVTKSALKGTYRLVLAQMLRPGDLLLDSQSRQELFRSISHEIRTSVLSLTGYFGMLKAQSDAKDISQTLGRMESTLARLEKVASRLDDFKVEMDVMIEDDIKRKLKRRQEDKK